jgi:hypothetical protein
MAGISGPYISPYETPEGELVDVFWVCMSGEGKVELNLAE